jgi:hypothetical protein
MEEEVVEARSVKVAIQDQEIHCQSPSLEQFSVVHLAADDLLCYRWFVLTRWR